MVRWGILGCGDVTEVKSGPALRNAPGSTVVAVMRRDAAKAEDYARRHGVPRWYTDADALIGDEEVDAVYIATPPTSHADLTERVFAAGKPVLVEKPMAMTPDECRRMIAAADEARLPLSVAYYRRALPRFTTFARLATDGTIGTPRVATITHLKPRSAWPEAAWVREIAGGIFADSQCHTIDWLGHVFGPAQEVCGFSECQADGRTADFVGFTGRFGDLAVTATCAYSVNATADAVTIHGDAGSVSMSFFRAAPIMVTRDGVTTTVTAADPPHVHQPFVEQVVAHIRGDAPNPCSGQEALHTAVVMESIVRPAT